MKATLTTLILTCLFLFAGAAAASTPDGLTPSVEALCDDEHGAAFGLCNAYCEAMDCELAHDEDPLTEPHASEQACTKVGDKFMNFTGRNMPCQAATVCSCFQPGNWDDADLGVIWPYFAMIEFTPGDTTASDDGVLIRLIENPDDLNIYGAAVDASALECQVFAFDDTAPILTLAITAAEVDVCRELLTTAASGL